LKVIPRWFAIASLLMVLTTAGAQTLGRSHPYLLYTDADIQQYRERIGSSPADTAAYDKLLQETEELNRPQTQETMQAACLAFRMTGRDQFARNIKAGLQRLDQKADFSDAELLKRDPPWHSGLATSGTVLAFAIGFDCIYPQLSPVERQHFADALLTKGLHPILDDWLLEPTRIHSLDTMGHNWWSAMVFNAGVGAMAILQERPDVLPWLQRISEASKEWSSYSGSELETKPANFDRNGGFYESVNYADFAMSEYLRFAFCWKNAFKSSPLPQPQFLQSVGNFFVQASYVTDDHVIPVLFGDGSLHSSGYTSVNLLWALGEKSKSNLWYLHQFDAIPPGDNKPQPTAFALVYGPSVDERTHAPATPELPDTALYPDMGWAMLRTSWEKGGTLFAIKSGMTFNHAHADAGSFMLFHHGDALLIESGGSPGYSVPEYDNYYRQSRAHNVVLFDGEAEFHDDTYFGSQFPGSLTHLIDAGNLKYIMADNTGPTVWKFRRNFRHILWIGNVILIVDDVKSYQPGQFQWLLHVGEKATVKDGDMQVAGPHGEVLVRPLFPVELPPGLPADFPEAMRVVEQSGFKDHDIKHPDTYYSFEPPGKTDQTTFVAALILKGSGTPEPLVERFRSENVDGVRITQSGTVTEVYVNTLAEGRIRHRNAIVDVNDWETDAYLTALTFPQGADRTQAQNISDLFVVDGSYLRRDGVVVYDSLSKVFMNVAYSVRKLDVIVQGQPGIDLSILPGAGKEEVTVNGKRAFDSDTPRNGLIQISTKP
jgi:oligo-alginate lyase